MDTPLSKYISELPFHYYCSGYCLHSASAFHGRTELGRCICQRMLGGLYCFDTKGELPSAVQTAFEAGDRQHYETREGTCWLEVYRAAPQVLIHVCELAWYLWHAEGNTLKMYRYPGVEDRYLEHFLFATVIPLIHSLNARLVLHASAFALGDRAWICLGDSGSGKSSFAMEAQRRGFEILADDYILVERTPSSVLVWPSDGTLRIRPDMHARFFETALEPSESLELFAGKYQLKSALQSEENARPRTLAGVLYLSNEETPGQELDAQEAFRRTIQQVFFGVASLPESKGKIFAEVAAVVSETARLACSSRHPSLLEALR